MAIKKQTLTHQYIQIDHTLKTPIYRQIERSVINEIKKGCIQIGEQLPSINAISEECVVSRETVVKAYKALRNKGIITSSPGKGYYFRSLKVEVELNVCLLFNKLSLHKKVIYDAIIQKIGKTVNVELFIYHNDFSIFKNLIESNLNKFTHFIIISHFYGVNRPINKVLEKIPVNKLVILDRKVKVTDQEYPAVYQNFSQDIYKAMVQAKAALLKYDRITLVYPDSSYHPVEIKKGFIAFCEEQRFKYQVKAKFECDASDIKEAFILLEDHDLVELLREAKDRKMELGKDIGVISYNENPLKEFIAGGITVMSTDFAKMGETAAQMMLEGRAEQVENPFYFIHRNSL